MVENKKMWKILGIIIVVGIIGWGGISLQNNHSSSQEEKDGTVIKDISVSGSTSPTYKGEDTLGYQFSIAGDATSTPETDDRTLIVSDAHTGARKMFIYLSNESARKSSPEEYFKRIILPKIDAATTTSTIKFGDTVWFHAETTNMEWSIASVKNGTWLVLVEANKEDNDAMEAMMKSLQIN